MRLIKKLSQHFIRDQNLVNHMIDYANLKSSDVVLEIGPGRGIITKAIVEKCKVIAVEKDPALVEYLKLQEIPNLEIITGDILKTKLPKFNKIIANLPFSISGPVTFKLFEYKWDSAVLIYQKEFAERFVAKPGQKSYSRLTLAVNYYSEPKIVKKISKGRFYPVPKVDAVLVSLKPKKAPFKTDKAFWELVNKLFQHKKKTLRAAMISSKFSKIVIERIPKELLKKRVVRCTLFDIRDIYTVLY
ncbi:MAG: ribosomal RNA small subunit methyltransferase A [Candidatus Aenigmarchaeota archaeon]|nr:ribosomal RNA small subunit methyltransferase A [Candidatus Aenigmarchaeota archaeon]